MVYYGGKQRGNTMHCVDKSEKDKHDRRGGVMRGKRATAMLLTAVLTVTLLGGCTSANRVTEDMIPTVTDLRDGQPEETQADVMELAMNKSYVAELTRLDGDNTQMAAVDEKEIPVVLKATSVDKDLKVKIVNQKNGKVITGTAFEVSVTDSAKNTKTYTDEDKDGVIYVKSMEPGKCKISMKASGGYSAPADITAEVKANIQYTVVDVADEIKSESEINVSKEDANTNGNSSAGTAQTLKDTVEYVASSKTEITEEVKTQKKDQWGQLVYSKLKKDKYGTDMYAKIVSEPASDHADSNGDQICDRCGANLAPAHTHTYDQKVVTKEATCTDPGTYEMRCAADGAVGSTGEIPALGHEDKDADGKCDRCQTDLGTAPTEPQKPEEGGDSAAPQKDEGTPAGEGVADTQKFQDERQEGSAVPTARVRAVGRMLLAAAASEKIVYDTSSAPVYDTGSEPLYDVTQKVTGYKYTGWQTIDGATYYFDKEGNKVTGSQVIQGIQYTFSSEGVRSGTIGIDVSKYQTSINWQKVKNAGINFVIIRCGYRGYGSGVLVQDPMFASHITGAKGAGLRVGIYFFSQAITEAEAVEEASMAVKLANQYGINMPIAIDSEYAAGGRGRADGLSKSARTRITVAFCNTVASAGYKPMVYASKSWFSSHLDVSQFPSSYRIWVAHYAEKCGYTGRYDIWQNTSKGSVDGVKGNVDMNISSI